MDKLLALFFRFAIIIMDVDIANKNARVSFAERQSQRNSSYIQLVRAFLFICGLWIADIKLRILNHPCSRGGSEATQFDV